MVGPDRSGFFRLSATILGVGAPRLTSASWSASWLAARAAFLAALRSSLPAPASSRARLAASSISPPAPRTGPASSPASVSVLARVAYERCDSRTDCPDSYDPLTYA
eukprot:732236-Prorocentrum_minimum.AAC.1